jgi:two-component system alkaline phosphatase synthesis response regulator PhoP
MKTILIVDDTEDFAENTRFSLSRAGYNVVLAVDGKEGFEQAMRVKPDLILMDVLMPQQDGVETVAKINEHETLKDIPVIFLTSVTAGSNVVMSVKGKDYPGISKLADFDKLLAKIRSCLGD